MSEEHRGVTQEEVVEAVGAGMKDGIAALAAALKSGQASAVTVRTGSRQAHPFAMIGIAVALAVPLGGWLTSLSNRVSVLEAQQSALQTASVEIASLHQEMKDFREEFERWQLRADPASGSLESFRRQFTEKDAK